MTEFKKYQHVERLSGDNPEVEGLLNGKVYIQPKIDGTNGVVGCKDGQIWCGKRTAILGEGADNQKFKQTILADIRFKAFFRQFPDLVLYGEWLVPHTIKEYVPSAWEKFYVFDVVTEIDGEFKYLNPDTYIPMLASYKIDFVPIMDILDNPDMEEVKAYTEQNHFLLPEGMVGEGIVIKNYDYHNPYGRQTWGKIVRPQFKEKMYNNIPDDGRTFEQILVDDLLTREFVLKEYEKIIEDIGGFNGTVIPRLLGTVYYEFIRDEMPTILKKYKHPTINFKKLKESIEKKVKAYMEW